MRKTRKCDRTRLQSSTVGGRVQLVMRTCLHPRDHADAHLDEHGAWKEPDNGTD